MKTDITEDVLEYGSQQIPYRLHRAKRKNLRIVVSPDMTVDVYAPERAGKLDIQTALNKKKAWIARKLVTVDEYQPLPTPIRYISGETIMYLGRQYRLRVNTGSNGPAKLSGKFLCVSVKDKNKLAQVKQKVGVWFQNHAHSAFHRYFETCYAVASRHGVPNPTLTIRTMKTRWGSCSRAGRITLNSKLIQVPVHCIEYVIMHELCHLLHHNHSPKFYSLLTRCQPDWRRRKEVLDQFKLA